MSELSTPKLLVASPFMDDHEFQHTVLVVVSESSKGALAFVLTRELAKMIRLDEVLMDGGPVSRGIYFVTLHSGDWRDHSTKEIGKGLFLSSMADTLDAVSKGFGPTDRIHLSGYVGFDPGEIEETVAEGLWLPLSFDSRFLFEIPVHLRWIEGLRAAGQDPTKFVGIDFHPDGERPS